MQNLIGREEQLDALGAALRHTMAGTPQIVFVTGEPGIGKSYLVEGFTRKLSATTPGVVIAKGDCSTVSGGPGEPFAPVCEILQALTGESSENMSWSLFRKVVAELAPDWISVIPVAGDVVSATIRSVQFGKRTWDAYTENADANSRLLQFTRVLRKVSDAAPLLLWIEDLHWADAATIDLISFLADHIGRARLMLIATYRTTDVAVTGLDRSRGLKGLISRLMRYGKCREIALSGFTADQVREYVSKEHLNLPDDFVLRLYRQSGGNPLFVAEYLHLLHQRQLLRFTIQGFVLVQPHVEIEIPGSLQHVINERLDMLGEELRRMLSYASVQGERFASIVLTHLLGEDELRVLEKLNALEHIHRIVRELVADLTDSKPGTEYEFVHALIQRALYDNLSTAQRRVLHLKTAYLLQDLYVEQSSAHASELAYHFEHAAHLEDAIRYYLVAAGNGLKSLALDDAAARAEDVLRLVHQVTGTVESRRWRAEALLYLAEAQHLKAQYDAAVKTCAEGEAFCQQNDMYEMLARFLYWRSLSLFRNGDVGDSVPPLRTAISALGDNPKDRQLLAWLHVRVGSAYRVLPEGEAKQALETAMSIAAENNLPEVRAKALIEMAGIAINHNFAYGVALRYAQEAFLIAKQQALIYEQLRALEWLAHACRFLQCGSDAIAYDEQAIEIARKSGLPRAHSNAYHSLAISQREVRHDWRASLTAVHEAVAIADRFGFSIVYGVFTDWFNAAFGLGQWDEARRALTRHRQLLESHASYPRQWGFYFWREGLMAYTHGLHAEAISYYEEALTAFGGSQSLSERDTNYVMPDMALAKMSTGELGGASKAIDQALMYWEQKDLAWQARCLRVRGLVNLAQGDVNGAVASLKLALPLSSSYTYHPWPDWAHVHSNLALALFALGKPTEALEPAREGYQGFKEIGHFLTGEAAFVLAQVIATLDGLQKAETYFAEARESWNRHGLSQSRIITMLLTAEGK